MYDILILALIAGFFYLRRQIQRQTKRIDFLEAQVRLKTAVGPEPQVTEEAAPVQREAEVLVPPPEPQASGPWSGVTSTPLVDSVAVDPPRAFVFRQDTSAAIARWVKENWFYGVAAISLALAAVFLVQYGVENGLLTPIWRVVGTLTLGVALIAAGEWVRRRTGDEGASHTAYLPSTFSGAGVVALFVGVLAARQLYGLIGPEAALVGLVMVSLVSIVLGWFYGPMLTVVGILGATVAPFLVGGPGGAPHLFFYFFALIAIVGLGIDTVKHWAWPSVMALIAPYLAALYIFGLGAGDLHLLAFGLIVTAAGATLPVRNLWPDHGGAMVTGRLWPGQPQTGWPEFPTRLAFGSFVATGLCTLLVVMADRGDAQVLAALIAISLMFGAAVIWFRTASALTDLALLPPVLFIATLVLQAAQSGAFFMGFQSGGLQGRLVLLVGLAAAGSMLGFWRARMDAPFGNMWAAGAALFAPLTISVLEGFWHPGMAIGVGHWAMFVMAIAALMTVLAQRIAGTGDGGHLRASFFAMAALSMISLSLMLVLSSVALTVTLAVTVLLAARLDVRFDLRLLCVFVQIGVMVCSWRLVVDPGIPWAVDAPVLDVMLAFGAVIALLLATWISLKQRERWVAIVTTDSAIWSLSAVLIVVLLYRLFGEQFFSFWGLSLTALVWLISAGVQGYRLQAGSRLLRLVRLGLASIFSLIGGAVLALATIILNPLLISTTIEGPYVFDTLMVGYGLPAVLFAALARTLSHVRGWIRGALVALSAGFAALYLGLEIRRLWRGDDLSVPATTGPELYTYTVVMLLAAIGLLFFAFSRRSKLIYRIAIFGVGLTIAKVFLIDTSGLTGLIRVASFLGLGLALAGLAWANSQMKRQWLAGQDAAPPRDG